MKCNGSSGTRALAPDIVKGSPPLVGSPAPRFTPSLFLLLPFLGGVWDSLVLRNPIPAWYIHMTDRGTCWSVTCNLANVTRDRVEDCIQNARLSGWGIEGQIERGEQGTEHYQLMVKTPQVRFSAVKKMFPTAHIELARNRIALEAYVHKEETRVQEVKKVEVTFLTYPQVRNQFFAWARDQVHHGASYDHDDRLALWDRFIGLSIEEGMECDLIGMNPQNRACIAKYWVSYFRRIPITDRQTDSQTINVPLDT